jgi:hypothetical protein
MTLQNFFPGMGIEEQLETQGRVLAEQIESCDRLRRHAAKLKKWDVVAEAVKEIAELQETLDALRQLSLPAAGLAAKATFPEPLSSERPVKLTGGRGDPR